MGGTGRLKKSRGKPVSGSIVPNHASDSKEPNSAWIAPAKRMLPKLRHPT